MIEQNNLAANLIRVMKSHGITTAKLSLDIGIPEITINKIRNGQNKNPTVGTLLPIVEYFNITLDELFCESERKIESGMQIFNMDGSIADEILNFDKYFDHIDCVIKITCENYHDYKKGSLLLIRKQEAINEDMIVIKLNECLTPCKAIIECGVLTGKSLIYPDKYYQLSESDILGIVVGTIWKRN